MEFLEIPLYDDDLLKLFVRFAWNLFFLTLIVRFAIYPSQRERDFAFTAVMMNITVFFICFSLKKLELGLGMALGLFAIFGVLRYRTDVIRTKEMTYLFIVIGVAVINALSNKQTSYLELAAVNFAILAAALLKERIIGLEAPPNGVPVVASKASKYTVTYDKFEWLKPECRAELLADLRERTGIEPVRVQIQSIDLESSTAILSVWYHDSYSKEEE
jgi:Domain of unknown function (DUF4956)